MFAIVQVVITRFKALFLTRAALELDADLIASCAERKAELLRRAKRYADEGLHQLAQNLTQEAEMLSPQAPPGGVLEAITRLQKHPVEVKSLPLADSAPTQKTVLPAVKKKAESQ